ncbi:hypothetical protein M406DRAFT_69274 [Cryphonectria parasitica EP155]|uniref:Major facilitator superfamily (MFS) profile domain-containing protein n=1 Tax=Cryphonectria parasitica (strain ATCC 38755 / EP155) TaxID=660469 RepID=A0A9P4Y5Y6_CRYP1|nr:uncharacterized protein M406DRAFT_69274 [Cryphonectria parasitica EP155]KAF3767110.1 hypothetical protein M406DRAFT_69274 [Cryphonectria parasitica EP155]
MEAALLSQLVAVESAPARPQRSVTKTYPAVPQGDDASSTAEFELVRISRPATHTGGYKSGTVTPNYFSRPPTPDLESRPASPVFGPDDGAEALHSIWDPYMNRFRLLSACLTNLGNGLSDAASGPLLPYMEKYYNIGYAVVSLIFVGQAAGFILGAGLIDPLRERLGRGRAIALSKLFMTGGYAAIACTAPFPVIVVAFFLIGLGMSINLALGNIFCGSLANSTTALGAMHGAYGIGGICGPLIANAFVTVLNLVWSRYYLLTLAASVLNSILALWSYWHFETENADTTAAAPLAPTRSSSSRAVASKLRGALQAFRSRVVVLGALFIFAYQGAEVSISGWVISFLEDARHGAPSRVGYVTSGFWAGITLGRFILSIPAHRIGERIFVYGIVVGAAIFELLVWFVPNIVGDAVAVALVGLLLGPVYPCAAAIFMRTMSRSEKVSGMGVISAFGSSGGAAAPFTTGLLAQAAGTFVLHPIAIGLFAAMLVCWYGLPSERKRRD